MARYLVDDAYWRNPFGLGTTADRSRQAQLVTQHKSEFSLAEWFEHDGVFQTIVSRPIEDALRGGFIVQVGNANEAETSTGTQDQVNKWVRESGLIHTLKRYFVQERLFGGSVLLQATNRDQAIMRPDSAAPDPQSRFIAFAPSELTPLGQYDYDPFSENFGFPLRWSLTTVGSANRPHREFDASWTRPTRSRKLYASTLSGSRSYGTALWTGPTIAYTVQSQIEHWGISQQAAVAALQKLSQPVLATNILRAAQTSDDAKDVIQLRLNSIDERAASQQTIVIDPEERLEILQSTVTGIDQVLDRLMVALSAAARIPVTILFGVSPGGFGTGESELKVYYDTIRAMQREHIAPAIEWVLKRTFPGSERWSIEFPPVDAPTQREELEMREAQSRIDNAYYNMTALSPDEIANSRFAGNQFSHETTLDLEARAAAKEAMELSLGDEPNENDPNSSEQTFNDPNPDEDADDDEAQ
jgi:phage-related protein (TIGR01555 family)